MQHNWCSQGFSSLKAKSVIPSILTHPNTTHTTSHSPPLHHSHPTELTSPPTPTTSAALMGLQEHKDTQWCIHFLQISVAHPQTAQTRRLNWPSSQAHSTTTLGLAAINHLPYPSAIATPDAPLTHPLTSSHIYQSLLLASWHPHPFYVTTGTSSIQYTWHTTSVSALTCIHQTACCWQWLVKENQRQSLLVINGLFCYVEKFTCGCHSCNRCP